MWASENAFRNHDRAYLILAEKLRDLFADEGIVTDFGHAKTAVQEEPCEKCQTVKLQHPFARSYPLGHSLRESYVEERRLSRGRIADAFVHGYEGYNILKHR